MKRSKGAGKKGKGKDRARAQSSGTARVEEANAAVQRGRRREGAEAMAHFQTARTLLEEALAEGLGEDDTRDAQVLLGETLQRHAAAALAAEAALPDDRQTAGLEREACEAASVLLERAVQVLSGLRSGGAGAWAHVDAAVNCGNCLTELAELQPPAVAVPLLETAVEHYADAVTMEADCLTWSNKADTLIQLAKARSEGGDLAGAAAAVRNGRTAYLEASQLCHSDAGDDLPGLLCNWAAGLVVAGGIATQAQERDEAVQLLLEAVQKVHLSLDFNRMDIQVPSVLADAYIALSEAEPEKAVSHTQGALQAMEAALKINSRHGPSLIAHAEACHAAARALQSATTAGNSIGEGGTEVATGGTPDPGLGTQPAQTSLTKEALLQGAKASYERALQAAGTLGSCSDRCTIRYNYACVLAQMGDLGAAMAMLEEVAGRDPGVAQGAHADDEFMAIWALPRFQALVQSVQVTLAS